MSGLREREIAEVPRVTPLDGPDPARWEPVCRLGDIDVEGGVPVLVRGEAVAVFRTWDGAVHALSHYDPCARAAVLARGIVGTRGDVPFVASPMHKQAFDLRTGQCLDDAAVRVTAYDVQVVDGTVWVGPAREPGQSEEAGRSTPRPPAT